MTDTIAYKYIIKTYHYGKQHEKEKKKLCICFADKKYDLIRALLESEIGTSNPDNSTLLKGVRSVIEGKSSSFRSTGNECTLEVTTLVSKIVSEVNNDESCCKIKTTDLYKIMCDWAAQAKMFYETQRKEENTREKIDLAIRAFMKDSLHMTEQNINDNIAKLNRHEDIKNELCFVILKGYVLGEKAIAVQGYTAEMLEARTYLDTLGAYNYLVYLRENPGEAIRRLKAGLPKK